MDDSATIFGEEIGRACHMQKGSQGEEQLLVQTPVNSDVVAVSVSGGNLKAFLVFCDQTLQDWTQLDPLVLRPSVHFPLGQIEIPATLVPISNSAKLNFSKKSWVVASWGRLSETSSRLGESAWPERELALIFKIVTVKGLAQARVVRLSETTF
ncbi:hypothetical protein DEO72_LG9g1425 [Vigna unguiculata]|uniref:Uncharacterized protein n=1 Tax=Vigna unguiculata TaxID=3917 RepID=A0A4D6MY83_VIGUN|nr:hypothetical protein DEO72_LG9g1425 [Vigna unguiculata]